MAAGQAGDGLRAPEDVEGVSERSEQHESGHEVGSARSERDCGWSRLGHREQRSRPGVLDHGRKLGDRRGKGEVHHL